MSNTKKDATLYHRTQFDGLGDLYSENSAIAFPRSDDRTRQEFKRETEVQFILDRYGLAAPQATYGEVDRTVDLQEAIRLRGELDAAWERLPEALRREYGSWSSVIQAADEGRLTSKDLEVVSAEQDKALNKEPDKAPTEPDSGV